MLDEKVINAAKEVFDEANKKRESQDQRINSGVSGIADAAKEAFNTASEPTNYFNKETTDYIYSGKDSVEETRERVDIGTKANDSITKNRNERIKAFGKWLIIPVGTVLAVVIASNTYKYGKLPWIRRLFN